MLADALKPALLSADLRSAVLRPIVGPTRAVRPPRLTPLHAIGFAVAAGLILAMLLPLNETWTRDLSIELTADDERELIAAYAVLQWNTPLDFAIERVSETIDDVYGSIERDSNAASVLPWGPDDEWDAPTGQESPSSRVWPLSLKACFGFCRLGTLGERSGRLVYLNGT